nr:uncharacterized protein LOC109179203 isoform X2 [Ipomoea batatas]
MCDCLHSALLSHSSVISTCNLGFNALPTPIFLPFLWYSKSKAQYASARLKPSSNIWDARTEIQWNRERRDEDEDENLSPRDGIEDGYLEFHGRIVEKMAWVGVKDEELVRSGVVFGGCDSQAKRAKRERREAQMMRRGVVLLIEVGGQTYPSGEVEWCLLEDVKQGLWSGQYRGNSIDELEDYADLEETQHPQPNNGKRRRRNSSRKKFKERNDDWEHPMDFI